MSVKKYIFKTISTIVLLFYIASVYATSTYIETQNATSTGSNNSINTFSKNGVSSGTYYINEGNNSDIIDDFLTGFYYNTLYGFFQLNWSSDLSKNVRIVGSTDACNSGYGYKLGGYAKSDTIGLIDFDYNQSVYVYYCLDDGLLHGKAYSDAIGYQSFEGLSFDILPSFSTSLLNTGTDSLFVNNTTTIFSTSKETVVNKSTPTIAKKESITYGEESIFYIWKTKK